jgi:hypothetical protein
MSWIRDHSSVGAFGTATLQADTAAIESASTGDSAYTTFVSKLSQLEVRRDRLAQQIEVQLYGAAFGHDPVHDAVGLTQACYAVIGQAAALSA